MAASFFLMVMTLVIGLHFPVLGYCEAADEVFFGHHHLEDHGHHDCDHGHETSEIPCEEEHEFVTVETGDFQWSPLTLIVPPVVLEAGDFEPAVVVFRLVKVVPLVLPHIVEPPPPDPPIFRRDAALRV